MRMDAATQLRYLDAMGITVWQRRAIAQQPTVSVVEIPEDTEQGSTLESPIEKALEKAISEPPPVVSEAARTAEPNIEIPAQGSRSLPADTSSMDWQALEATAKACTLCGLCEGRSQAVFGVGVQTADLMVIGEGPGAEEDRQGVPFVGPAGKLLDAMLAAISHSRAPQAEQKGVYIANVVKCRPPKNRDPKPDETTACRPYLERQIALMQPKLIMAVGRVAAQNLLGSDETLGRLRQQMHEYRLPDAETSIPVLVTYHPAYLLRSPQDKRKAWEDLKKARSLLV